MKEDKILVHALTAVVVGALLLGAYLSKPFYILAPGYTAIQMRLGKIIQVRREGGIYFMIPFVDTIVEMPNGICKSSIETSALSKDLQAISIGIDVNYRYIDEIELYKATRGRAEELILLPFCHESIKAVISKYTAEELILNRHEAKEKIYQDLRERLRPHYIEFIEVNFAHADFSHEFIKAVEDKQIAHQHAMMSKNLTEQVRERAVQLKLTADAQAYEQQVKKQSLTPDMVQLRAIEKWDGKLPTVVTGAVPFIDVMKKM